MLINTQHVDTFDYTCMNSSTLNKHAASVYSRGGGVGVGVGVDDADGEDDVGAVPGVVISTMMYTTHIPLLSLTIYGAALRTVNSISVYGCHKDGVTGIGSKASDILEIQTW